MYCEKQALLLALLLSINNNVLQGNISFNINGSRRVNIIDVNQYRYQGKSKYSMIY